MIRGASGIAIMGEAELMQQDYYKRPKFSACASAVTAIAIVVTLLGMGGTGAAATEIWEGLWAKTGKECRNQEGPDSKTLIDLKGSENGRSAPIYDQYENHCRIDRHAKQGNVITMRLSCYEFWDDYKAKKNPRRDTVTVTPLDPQKILMNGKPYTRCKK
jgi:hypothetical protein